MLNTFFFGYLSLKWRRLFRTLITLAYLPFIVFTYYEGCRSITYGNGYYETIIGEFNLPYFILLISIPTISIPLISWVIKPFVVKEN
jgi:hypothetical protein